MVGHADRVNVRHEARQLFKMPCINAGSRTQRQPDAMQADGVVLTCLAQDGARSTTGTKKILGMHLDEIEGRQAFKQLCVMRMPPANASGKV